MTDLDQFVLFFCRDEAQAEEVEYDEEEESLPIQARKEPEVEKPKKTYSARQSKAL